jgi:fucose permease
MIPIFVIVACLVMMPISTGRPFRRFLLLLVIAYALAVLEQPL